jgi:hypothetical protein
LNIFNDKNQHNFWNGTSVLEQSSETGSGVRVAVDVTLKQ